MFDLPGAKRVRRSEVYSRSESASPTPSEPDSELETQYQARLASLYGTSAAPNLAEASVSNDDSSDASSVELAEENPEQEFEFRLFASATTSRLENEEEAAIQRITLADEEEHLGDGGFVVPQRDQGLYFSEKAVGQRRQGLEAMALSGEEILSRAKRRAWGLEVPWRVQILKVTGVKTKRTPINVMTGTEGNEQDLKRKKPGKKRRIILRERKRLRDKIQEQRSIEQSKKEEAEREKRTRRNREKKVKRKLKEKANKSVDDDSNGVILPTKSSGAELVGTVSDL